MASGSSSRKGAYKFLTVRRDDDDDDDEDKDEDEDEEDEDEDADVTLLARGSGKPSKGSNCLLITVRGATGRPLRVRARTDVSASVISVFAAPSADAETIEQDEEERDAIEPVYGADEDDEDDEDDDCCSGQQAFNTALSC